MLLVNTTNKQLATHYGLLLDTLARINSFADIQLVSYLFLVIECTVNYCTVDFEFTTGHGTVAGY